jgi:hypothetical protein
MEEGTERNTMWERNALLMKANISCTNSYQCSVTRNKTPELENHFLETLCESV